MPVTNVLLPENFPGKFPPRKMTLPFLKRWNLVHVKIIMKRKYQNKFFMDHVPRVMYYTLFFYGVYFIGYVSNHVTLHS